MTALLIERPWTAWSAQLVLVTRLLWCVRPLAAFLVLECALAASALPVQHALLAAAALVAALPGTLVRLRARRAVVRIGCIGGVEVAARLQGELDAAGDTRRVVAMSIVPPKLTPTPAPWLQWLGRVVRAERLGLVVVSAGAVTLESVRTVAGRTRATDLTGFHEEVFGTVALAEVDVDWFAALPTRADGVLARGAKRAFDIVIALALLVTVAPLIGLLAFLVRRHDGGPAFFRQQRVGRDGRLFELCKLRTMTHATIDGDAPWTVADDARVTPIGRVLRSTHLDELPQLMSILRGEMTLVGPRPEQVGYSTALNGQIPFYARRLDVKPGLTGWAQVRCGYGGSLEGSAFKLCNDLYYLKNRSVLLDLAIIIETAHAVLAGPRFDLQPANAATLLGSGERRVVPAARPAPEPAVV